VSETGTFSIKHPTKNIEYLKFHFTAIISFFLIVHDFTFAFGVIYIVKKTTNRSRYQKQAKVPERLMSAQILFE